MFRDKAFNIAKSPEYDGYHRGLASIVYKFFYKKGSIIKKGTRINSDVVSKNK